MNFARTGHGAGRGKPRIEVPLKDLPAGIAAPPTLAPVPASGERAPGGTFAPGSCTAQRLGGQKSAETRRQLKALKGLGLRGAAPAELAPYLSDAQEFAEHEIARHAAGVGGGICGAGPSALVQNAALLLAASRAAFARGEDALGSKLCSEFKGTLLAAHALCAQEAKARPAPKSAYPWLLLDEPEPTGPKAPNALLAALTAEEP